MVPSSLPKNSSQTNVMHTQEGLMVHVRGACAQRLPMFARGVSSSSPTALQRHVTYRNDWKLEPAVQKVRGVNIKQSLRRPWYVSHLIQLAAKLGARPKRSVLALVCGSTLRRIAVRSANGRGTGKGRRCKAKERLWRSSRLSWQSRSSRTRSKSGSCKRA